MRGKQKSQANQGGDRAGKGPCPPDMSQDLRNYESPRTILCHLHARILRFLVSPPAVGKMVPSRRMPRQAGRFVLATCDGAGSGREIASGGVWRETKPPPENARTISAVDRIFIKPKRQRLARDRYFKCADGGLSHSSRGADRDSEIGGDDTPVCLLISQKSTKTQIIASR
jgi:hypothetical protein